MKKLRFCIYTLVLSSVFSSFCMNNIHEISVCLEKSIGSFDDEGFLEALLDLKSLDMDYLINGETPLTLVLQRLDKEDFDFFYNIIPYMYRYVNKENKHGQLPLEIALRRDLMEFAVLLVKEGADILFVKRDLLSKKIDDKLLLNELVHLYVQEYCDVLSYLKRGGFQPKISRNSRYRHLKPQAATYTLEYLIDLYCLKLFVDGSKDGNNETIFEVLRNSKEKICKVLGQKGFKRRYLNNACLCFMNIFGVCGAFGVHGVSQVNEVKKLIKKEFGRFEKKINKNIEKLFSCKHNLLENRQNKKFIDMRIICIK